MLGHFFAKNLLPTFVFMKKKQPEIGKPLPVAKKKTKKTEPMPSFDEFMTRIVRVKPEPKKK